MSRRLMVAALLMATPLVGARAQETVASVAVGAVTMRFGDQPVFSALTVSPSARVLFAHLTASATGTFSLLGEAGWSQQGAMQLSAFTAPSPRGFILEASGTGGGSRHPDGAATGQGLGSARLHWARGMAVTWFGAGMGAMHDGASWRTVRHGELGLAWRPDVATLTMLVTPTVTDDTLAYTDFLGAIGLSRGPLDLSASLGARAGASLQTVAGDQRIWGGIGLVAWVASRAAVTAAVGTYPVDFTQGFPAGQYLSLGLRFGAERQPQRATTDGQRLGAGRRTDNVRDFVVRRAGEDRVEVRVHAPKARLVALNGDLTGWTPVDLLRASDGWWVGTFRASAAVVELVVRVDDGPWSVPPNAMLVRDEFGASSGRFIVSDRK